MELKTFSFKNGLQVLFGVPDARAGSHYLDIAGLGATFDGSVTDLMPMSPEQAAIRIKNSRLLDIVRMVISESRAFPDLASIWHDEVLSRVLTLLTKIV